MVGASSPPAPLQLRAVPATTPFTPSSPGILLTLPSRALHPGETFAATLAAVNPLPQVLSGWSVPVRYSALELELVGVAASGLWQQAVTSVTTAGSYTVRTITVRDRAAGQPLERFRTSSSIPLATLTFVVRATVPGAYTNAVTVPAGAMLDPSWLAPPVAVYDHRGGIQAAGSVLLNTTRALGVWAWGERGHAFNTARFTGARVATQLSAAYVRSWGVPAAVPVAPSTCSGTAGLLSGAASLDASLCVLNLDALNTAPAKDLVFTLGSNGSYSTVTVSVWQPARVAFEVDDPTLNSVLPLNAAPTSAGCTDRYQATRLRATADWINGGGGAGDIVAATDVTALATFVSNDSSVALVLGPTVRGISAGSASVRLAAPITAAPAAITVVDTPTCLLALEALATTGVALVTAALPPPAANRVAVLGYRAAQDLTWEGAAARVVTYARFSDGAAMDVSDRTLLALDGAAAAGAGGLMPFGLSVGAAGGPVVTVNASVSGAGPTASCGAFLAASWEVCSRLLGSGSGQLVMNLPKPLAVVTLDANPAVITPAADPAALPPIGLPTVAELTLSVSFSDGTVRDFSADNRTRVVVTVGSTLCAVARTGTGTWKVTAVGSSSASGSCTVTAEVAFPGAAPLTAGVAVGVVAVRSTLVYDRDPRVAAPPTPPAGTPLGSSLRLLRCDARNYDQRRLWALAALTNCSAAAPGSCPLIDVNDRAWTRFNSSDASVFDVLGTYPSTPGGDGSSNRVVACCKPNLTLLS